MEFFFFGTLHSAIGSVKYWFGYSEFLGVFAKFAKSDC